MAVNTTPNPGGWPKPSCGIGSRFHLSAYHCDKPRIAPSTPLARSAATETSKLHMKCNDAMQCGFSARDAWNPDQDRRRENHCMQGASTRLTEAGTAAPGAAASVAGQTRAGSARCLKPGPVRHRNRQCRRSRQRRHHRRNPGRPGHETATAREMTHRGHRSTAGGRSVDAPAPARA